MWAVMKVAMMVPSAAPMILAFLSVNNLLGSYASVFQKYRASAPEYLVDLAHNDYLQLLAESGVVGFTIAGTAVLMILFRIVRGVRAGPTTAHRLLVNQLVRRFVVICVALELIPGIVVPWMGWRFARGLRFGRAPHPDPHDLTWARRSTVRRP
jgi:O-antigen ligase